MTRTVPRITSGGLGSKIDATKTQYTYYIENDSGVYKAFTENKASLSSDASLVTVWDAVMSDISTNPAKITFGKGIFSVTSALTIEKNNLSIHGQGKGITIIQAETSLPDTHNIFSCRPTPLNTGVLLDATTKRDSIITTSTAADAGDFEVGDRISVYNNEDVPNVVFSGTVKAHLHKVKTAGNPSTGVIELDGLIDETFAIGTVPKVIKLDPFYNNIGIHDMTIMSLKTTWADFPIGTVAIHFCSNFRMSGVEFDDVFDYTLWLIQVVDAIISNCHFGKAIQANGFNGSGVLFQSGTGCLVTNCSFDGHDVSELGVTNGSFAGRGIFGDAYQSYSKGLIVTGCDFTAYTIACISTHSASLNTIINGNHIDSSSAVGINLRSPAVIQGNTIRNVSDNAIGMRYNSHNSIIDGNAIINCSDGIIFEITVVTGVTITDNIFDSNSGIDIDFGTGTSITAFPNKHINSNQKFTTPVAGSNNIMSAAGAYYTNANRPNANTFEIGDSIWNEDDDAPNYSDGTNWRDAAGVIT